MNIAEFSIRRPVFISCIVILILIIGTMSYRKIGVALMPNVELPVIAVTTVYPGASPDEMVKTVSKPIEDALGTISGVKHINSDSNDGISIITVEFTMDTDVDQAAQDVRDKVHLAAKNFPSDLTADPLVQKFDPDSVAVISLALVSDLSEAEAYDLANEIIRPILMKIPNVGNVEIVGGTRREIQVELDQRKLNEYQIPVSRVVSQLCMSGSNVPIGKRGDSGKEVAYRSIGAFTTIEQIENVPASFSGDVGNSVAVKNLGRVVNGNEDRKSMSSMTVKRMDAGTRISDKKQCIFLNVIKKSGSNAVEVSDRVKKQLGMINDMIGAQKKTARLNVTFDQATWINICVEDAKISLYVGIFLSVLVVFIFLGSVRSTIITAVAIPNSLLGALIIMKLMGFTFNNLTLMALSLVVGLLVDDAIVVRENIYSKIEKGLSARAAAAAGTNEVMLAVIATTLVIIAVFLPIATLEGVIGKYFMEFGFTIVFAMIISLFDALTVAPFLSAHFAGNGKKLSGKLIRAFEKIQIKMECVYEKIMRKSIEHPLIVILSAALIFLSSIFIIQFIKSTFSPAVDIGELVVNIEFAPGTSLKTTQTEISKIEERLGMIRDIDYYTLVIGNERGESHVAAFDCFLVAKRKEDTEANKKHVREILSDFNNAKISVDDVDGKGGQREGLPFNLVVSGSDTESVNKNALEIYEVVKTVPDLVDIDSNIDRGKPEFKIIFDPVKMQHLGVSDVSAGTELRYGIAGAVAGKLRQNGLEYDIRVRLKPEQRNLAERYATAKVPNMNGNMVPLLAVSRKEQGNGSSHVYRRDNAYIVTVSANLKPGGALGDAMSQAKKLIEQKVKLLPGVQYSFTGQSEMFSETSSGLLAASILSILFIYLVLASLYESFVIPITILLAIPPAITGALFALFLTGQTIDIFSMIGMIMLMGIVTKNSILLVDYAMQGIRSGLDRNEAILAAGKRRLRPILMTTCAMLAGTLPLALGIGVSAKMRQSMGIAIMGGLIVSTLITLIVVPAIFGYIDRFRTATESKIICEEKSKQ